MRPIHGQIQRRPSVRSEPLYSPNSVITTAWFGWIMKKPAEMTSTAVTENTSEPTKRIFAPFDAPLSGAMPGNTNASNAISATSTSSIT